MSLMTARRFLITSLVAVTLSWSLACLGSGEVGFSAGRTSTGLETYRSYLNVYEHLSGPYYLNLYAQHDYNFWGSSSFGKLELGRALSDRLIVGVGVRSYLTESESVMEGAASVVLKLW